MTKQFIMTTPSAPDTTFKEYQQWSDLRNMLLDVGADVIVMPDTPSKRVDSVYCGDYGTVYKNDFIVGRFKHARRQVDEHFIAEWFQEHRFDILYNPSYGGEERPDTFEGSDVVISHDRKHLWFGFGHRSSHKFKAHLDDLLDEADIIVRPILLKDPRFYHLSMVMNTLDTGDLLWYPNAFHPHSKMNIEMWYEGKMIEITEEDALNMVCNAISIHDTIIVSKITPQLKKTLEDRGYDVIIVDTSEFGNSCKRLAIEMIE
jgi:N-dimethylarginine dimethylaminohydrolase